jgi:hypothetical protein
MFVFGKNVKPGVVGTNADLNNLPDGNLPEQHDYRQVFTTLLQDWMGASDETINKTLFQDYLTQKLSLIDNNKVITGEPSFFDTHFRLNNCHPNPVRSHTTFSYYINAPARTTLGVYSSKGQLLIELVNADQPAGFYEVPADLSRLAPGAYFYRIESGRLKTAKTLLKQ